MIKTQVQIPDHLYHEAKRIARERLSGILRGLKIDGDGIYSSEFANTAQQEEVELRQAVAGQVYGDYLGEIARHHSIPVMDREVSLFLKSIPMHGVIVDVGGCWGWHWRKLSSERPDVTIVIVDFIKDNLRHAMRLLGKKINETIFLVHGDATKLPFPDNSFDGYWSVQTLQHVPDFQECIQEAHRILLPKGCFASYSLNRTKLVETIYRLCGKKYNVKGVKPGSFFLARASDEQERIIFKVFGKLITRRYTEVLFHPDLKFRPGCENSVLGALDSWFSSNWPIFSWLAGQRSFHCQK